MELAVHLWADPYLVHISPTTLPPTGTPDLGEQGLAVGGRSQTPERGWGSLYRGPDHTAQPQTP